MPSSISEMTAAVEALNASHQQAHNRAMIWRRVLPTLKAHLETIAEQVNSSLGPGATLKLKVHETPQPGKVPGVEFSFSNASLVVGAIRDDGKEAQLIEIGASLLFHLRRNGLVEALTIPWRFEPGPPRPGSSPGPHCEAERLEDFTFVTELVRNFVVDIGQRHWSGPQAEQD